MSIVGQLSPLDRSKTTSLLNIVRGLHEFSMFKNTKMLMNSNVLTRANTFKNEGTCFEEKTLQLLSKWLNETKSKRVF